MGYVSVEQTDLEFRLTQMGANVHSINGLFYFDKLSEESCNRTMDKFLKCTTKLFIASTNNLSIIAISSAFFKFITSFRIYSF